MRVSMRAAIVIGVFLAAAGAPAAHAADCARLGDLLPPGKFAEAEALCVTQRALVPQASPLPAVAPLPQADPLVTQRPLSVAIPFRHYATVMPILSVGGRTPAAPHGDLIDRIGLRYRIDPALLSAIVHAESRYRMDAVSPKGALGLMQVMPDTARSLGVAQPRLLLTDAELAVETGARYLKQLQDRFGNDVTLVVAAYNAGPGAVERHGRRVPPYRETQGYVRSVLTRYASTRGAARR